MKEKNKKIRYFKFDVPELHETRIWKVYPNRTWDTWLFEDTQLAEHIKWKDAPEYWTKWDNDDFNNFDEITEKEAFIWVL